MVVELETRASPEVGPQCFGGRQEIKKKLASPVMNDGSHPRPSGQEEIEERSSHTLSL